MGYIQVRRVDDARARHGPGVHRSPLSIRARCLPVTPMVVPCRAVFGHRPCNEMQKGSVVSLIMGSVSGVLVGANGLMMTPKRGPFPIYFNFGTSPSAVTLDAASLPCTGSLFRHLCRDVCGTTDRRGGEVGGEGGDAVNVGTALRPERYPAPVTHLVATGRHSVACVAVISHVFTYAGSSVAPGCNAPGWGLFRGLLAVVVVCVCAAIALLLTIVMGLRFRASGVMMPAGVMTIVSLLMSVLFFVAATSSRTVKDA